MNGKRVLLPSQERSGFTLVEIMVVMAIIAILAGVLVPAVFRAVTTGKTAGIRAEVESLTQSVEAYKLKYGDYPPDFSSWPVVQTHYRNIFPDIALSELTLLFRMCDDIRDDMQGGVSGNFVPYQMDRAESLVWSLGGFSSDPQLPFTGTGGPLSLIPTVAADPSNATNPAVWQYNTARDNSLMEVETGDLTLLSPDPSTPFSFLNRVRSTDEDSVIGTAAWPTAVVADPFIDAFPIYRAGGEGSPYVYFDSRTYRLDASAGQLNLYVSVVEDELDMVRPVFDQRINANLPIPSASGSTYGTFTDSLRAWEAMSPNTFQILSPGLDGRFGQVADLDGGFWGDANPVYWQYPAGTMITADPTADEPQDLIVVNVDKYALDGLSSVSSSAAVRDAYEKDNIGNFCKTTFQDDLP